MPLPEILLVCSSLLVLAMIVASVCRHLPIPYTVLLVMVGLAINFYSDALESVGLANFNDIHLTSDLVLFVFLPALVFETALSLDARALLKNSVAILMLASIGMVVSTCLVGVGMWWSLNVPFVVALLFGSLISATDPVAVVALFKELGVSKRLNILVEGESLMNDATAIVLFNILLLMLTKTQFSVDDSLQAVIQFFYVFFGGITIGLLTGLLMSELLVRLYHGNQSIPVVLSLVLAYISFIIAEHYWHVSGVMAVLTAAICLNLSGLSRLSKKTIETIHMTWDFIVLICNALLFILIGMLVDLMSLFHYWQPILWAVIAVYIARAVSVYFLIPLTIRGFGLKKISWENRHIMWWGGLKGGLAIAIVLSIPESVIEKSLLITLTLGVVMTSLLLNAPTIYPLMRFLKMDLLVKDEEAELSLSLQQVNQSVNAILHRFASLQLLDNDLEITVESRVHSALDMKGIELSNEQLIRQVHLHALQAETEELNYLYELGLVNYYTLVTFKDILHTDKKHSIDYLNDIGDGWRQTNPLLKFEKGVIHLLSEKNWGQGLLTQYQTRRFSNKILHDIAGVLMAHQALKSINLMIDKGVKYDLIQPIKNIYKLRLQRRKNRLLYFSGHYPLFYTQYEAFLFQKVALRYSLKLVYKSHDNGMINAKVLRIVTKKLTDSLEQLSASKILLPIGEKEAWINKAPLFAGLSEACLAQLSSVARYVNFLPNDIIFSKGDQGESLYIIINGKVKIMTENLDNPVSYMTEGELVGMQVLSLNHTRLMTVVASSYVSCLRLTAKSIINFSLKNSELDARLQTINMKHKL